MYKNEKKKNFFHYDESKPLRTWPDQTLLYVLLDGMEFQTEFKIFFISIQIFDDVNGDEWNMIKSYCPVVLSLNVKILFTNSIVQCTTRSHSLHITPQIRICRWYYTQIRIYRVDVMMKNAHAHVHTHNMRTWT